MPLDYANLKFDTVKCGYESLGLGPEKNCANEAQQELQTTDPTSRQRGRPT
jgi:hypothetical protein